MGIVNTVKDAVVGAVAGKWVTVADSQVRHIWGCPDCDEDCEHKGEEIEVGPKWYDENGTPSCGCGKDAHYVRTEVCI